MTAGTPTARRCSRSRRSWASFPRTPSSLATTPTCRTGTNSRRTRRKLYARMMEVFAGFLTHVDHYIGELIQFLKDLGEYENTLIMVISDNGASAEGGPTRLGQREQVLQQRAGQPGAEPGGDRRHRRTEVLQSLPVGLDPRGQHAVPPLEARDLSRRRQRPVPRLLAQGDEGARRGPHPVRTRHRHGADRPRRPRDRRRRRPSAA